MALTDKLVAIGDAIRSKTGGTDPMTLDEMAEEISNISSGSDSQLDALIDGSITQVRSEVTSIRDYSFQYIKTLEKAIFPNVYDVGDRAFFHCENLASIDVPKVQVSDSYAFASTKIKEAIFPLLAKVGTYTFSNCTKLEKIECPVLPHTNANFCTGCTALTQVNMPQLQSLGSSAFKDCTGLEQISLPSVTGSISGSTFYGCTNLKTVKLGNANNLYSINTKVFYKCSALTTLVIPGNIDGAMICNISNIDAFYGTPFAEGGTGGTVYVPAALIEQYQQATNWSTLYAAGTCTFLPIEGSEYE